MKKHQSWEYLSLRANSWADVAACGAEGWELVTVLLEDPKDKGSRVYFFKRPVDTPISGE